MTTANEIVSDAAALIFVDEASTGLEAGESALLVRFLNDYCAELYDSGIDIGYRPVSSGGDIITSPASVNMALKYNLAARANDLFGMPLPINTAQLAISTEKTLRSNFVKPLRAQIPTNLPVGTGQRRYLYTNDAFYPFFQPVAALRLDSASTVDIVTASTPVQVGGWTIDRQVNVTVTAAGLITHDSEMDYLAVLEANLTVASGGGDELTFYFAKNGALIQQSALSVTSDVDQNILIKWPETLRRNDTVSLWVENTSDTSDVVINNGHIKLA